MKNQKKNQKRIQAIERWSKSEIKVGKFIRIHWDVGSMDGLLVEKNGNDLKVFDFNDSCLTRADISQVTAVGPYFHHVSTVPKF